MELFDVRRGAEGMRELRKVDFKLVENPNFEYRYYKKVKWSVNEENANLLSFRLAKWSG